MPRPAATQKTKVVQKNQCGSCGEIFTGRKCPNCEETNNIFPINADGLPSDVVADAVGSTHSLPITLQRSPDLFDADYELEAATRRQMKDVMQEAQLDKVRAAAAIQAAKRLRAEKELEATEKGFMPPKEGDATQQQEGVAGMSSAMFMQALGGWNPEARELLFDRLKADPEFAFNFSKVLNPQPGMPGMPQMSPMGWMGGMMQPPAEQPPQASAADMLTAVIAAVGALKDMSGGDGGDSKQMDRVMDKMDEMRKETENLRMQLVEERNTNRGISQDEVRIIIADALARSSEQRANIQEGVAVLNDLQSLKSGMIDLGLMQEVSMGSDKPTIEDRRLDHEIRRDEMQDKRDHEMRLAAEQSAQAAAESKGALVQGLFAAAQEQQDKQEEPHSDVETGDIPVVKADQNRQEVVIG